MTNGNRKTGKKYRVLELLKKLPYNDYRIAKKKLPLDLEVSTRTFERWIYLKTDSKKQIPCDKLKIIADYLKLKSMDDLFNFEIDQFKPDELEKLKSFDHELIKKFNLIKKA